MKYLKHFMRACSLKWWLYCKFGNFRENFIFVNSIKIHISDVLNSRPWLGHDLPIPVNVRVVLPFCDDFTLLLVTCDNTLNKYT